MPKNADVGFMPDTELELLKDIYTPDVPAGQDYDHITKDIVLSNFGKKDIRYLFQLQDIISLFKFMGLTENVSIAKQQSAIFVNANRGKDGFERKQQTTSVSIHQISTKGKGIDKDKILGGGKQ